MKRTLVGTTLVACCAALAIGHLPISVAASPQTKGICRVGETMSALGLEWRCMSIGGVSTMVATSSVPSQSSGPGLIGNVGQCRKGDQISLDSLRLECRAVANKLSWVGLKRGAAVGRASALVQARPLHLRGVCRNTSWLILNSIRISCATGQGATAWTARPSAASASPAKDLSVFAVQTMRQEDVNSEFRAWPGRWPQLAQWLQISEPRVISEVGFTIGFAESATAGWWADQGRWDLARITSSGSIPGNVAVSLWKTNDSAPPPSGFDLANGFTLVGESAPTGPIAIGSNTIAFTKPVNLDAGTYVLVLAFRSDDPDVLMISVEGRQHGDTQFDLGGRPNPCVYTPATDAYPQGAVYRSDPPYKTLIRGHQEPFSTVFVPVKGKVLACSVEGQYTDIGNPGDLRVGFN